MIIKPIISILFGKHYFYRSEYSCQKWGVTVSLKNEFLSIDAHGLKIQGRGYGMFLPKFLGGWRVSGKIAWGSTYFGFYCIFINKFFKNLPGGCCFIPSPHPPHPPCVHLCFYPTLVQSSRLIFIDKSFEDSPQTSLSFSLSSSL